MIEAVIFDMDGVLTNTVPLNMKARQSVCFEIGLIINEDDFPHLTGVTDHYAFNYLLKKYRINHSIEELIEKKVQYFVTLIEEASLFYGTLSVLKTLKSSYTLALTTSSLKRQQVLLFEHFKLTPFFELVISGEDISRSKPDPQPYQHTIQQLSVQPDHCLVIEDAINGIVSAKAAGARVVAVTHTHSREELHQVHPDLIVDRLEEIIPLINELNQSA